MLDKSATHATLPAQDIERAKKFYNEKLGLTPTDATEGGVTYKTGDTEFLLFPSSGKASGDHTQLSFSVADIDATVKELQGRGVKFIEYDTPDLKTVNGIADLGGSRGGWLKDSEGNLLAVFQRAKE